MSAWHRDHDHASGLLGGRLDADLDVPDTSEVTPGAAGDLQAGHGGHGGHGWMMIACCIPMLVVAVVLVATGVVSAGFLVAALACTAMMALMMRGMHSR